ncbi:hypothetical protein BFP70_08565 [Thioclava sp. SK-1]|nr:hypothetical protein BFP70_08565 [Thioclava sp. SK-1]
MSDQVLALLPIYGPWLVGAVTFLSCLAMPMPASLVMIAGGAFVASGDLALWSVAGSAVIGAVFGDMSGYLIGRRFSHLLPGPDHPRGRLLARAVTRLQARGAATVYLSRWLFSPLGPYVNFAAGATRYHRRLFMLSAAAGEITWVGIYTMMGVFFGANLSAAAALASDVLGMIAAGTVALALGWWLWNVAKSSGGTPEQ